MKKYQKWWLILMMIAPVILILTVFFIISDGSLKDIPWWAIIGVSVIVLVSPFTFFLAQRTHHTERDTTLQKQKKRVLNAFIFFIIFLVIILAITYYVNYQFFWVLLFCQTAFFVIMFFLNMRLFFPKEKKSIEYDNNRGN